MSASAKLLQPSSTILLGNFDVTLNSSISFTYIIKDNINKEFTVKFHTEVLYIILQCI